MAMAAAGGPAPPAGAAPKLAGDFESEIQAEAAEREKAPSDQLPTGH